MQVIYQGPKMVEVSRGVKVPSPDYVHWLETQFGESRKEAHMTAAKLGSMTVIAESGKPWASGFRWGLFIGIVIAFAVMLSVYSFIP